jgi:hypothetical protein
MPKGLEVRALVFSISEAKKLRRVRVRVEGSP